MDWILQNKKLVLLAVCIAGIVLFFEFERRFSLSFALDVLIFALAVTLAIKSISLVLEKLFLKGSTPVYTKIIAATLTIIPFFGLFTSNLYTASISIFWIFYLFYFNPVVCTIAALRLPKGSRNPLLTLALSQLILIASFYIRDIIKQ